MSNRKSRLKRKTNETSIDLELNLDGSGSFKADMEGMGFFSHVLELLARHSQIDINLKAKGDLHVDDHHLVEDLGIAIGAAMSEALGDKAGIERYGFSVIPMDEVLVQAAIDLSGRFTYVANYEPHREQVGELSTEMVNHFFASLASSAGMTLHLRVIEQGANEHHRIEALFKAFARAFRVAVRIDPMSQGAIPSTKGTL
jgi:imidazoleglycerol-phosphate dehydratase